MGNPVTWVEFHVKDLARARQFYGDLLQVEFTRLETTGMDEEMWCFPSDMEGYGCGAALVKRPGPAPTPGGATLAYFHCADVGPVAERAVAPGGRLIQPKTAIGQHGAFALVADPEGNVVGLHNP